ncbi:HEXXH motif domain-containing protein [Nonomuraea sp. NN258]|uniref:HEXXH motif domain-containing protein n=1 Tax=Nonomuraea antri TaxID=2730852 RepID=UPI0015682B25|nr:HEXXH motif domain-containing protein [Nonomuraea antri]NRQ32503.1 HEXXH motif domain-containing protein [Nonomuraea antri]
MTPAAHLMPSRLFDALARNDSDPEALSLLKRSQYSKHLLLLRTLVEETRRRGHPQASAVDDAYVLLTEVQKRAPAAVESVIRYPAVGAWALRVLWHLVNGHPPGACGAAQPRRLAALAVSAAVRGGVELTARLRTEGASLSLPSVGRAIFHGADEGSPARARACGGSVELTVGRKRVTVPAAARPVPVSSSFATWEDVRLLPLGSGLRIDDTDPFRFMPEARQRGRLPEAEVARWARTAVEGWQLLAEGHRVLAAEVDELISMLVPLAAGRRGLVSASTRAAFGCVALSRPPDAAIMAVTLAHEVQHVKLAALLDLFPLVESAPARYYAPWRDDPRPPMGLLHGTYAFTGVAAFWSRQRHAETSPRAALKAHTEFARWRQAAMETVQLLADGGHLTPLGRGFAAGLAGTLRELCEQSVPAEALSRARRAAALHRARWRERNGAA